MAWYTSLVSAHNSFVSCVMCQYLLGNLRNTGDRGKLGYVDGIYLAPLDLPYSLDTPFEVAVICLTSHIVGGYIRRSVINLSSCSRRTKQHDLQKTCRDKRSRMSDQVVVVPGNLRPALSVSSIHSADVSVQKIEVHRNVHPPQAIAVPSRYSK